MYFNLIRFSKIENCLMLIKGYGDTILQPEGFGNMYQTLNVQTL